VSGNLRLLFADDFDEDTVREGGAAEDVDDTVFGEAAEHGVGLRVGVGWSCGFRGVGSGFERRWGGLTGGVGAFHSTIHGFVGEAVGVLVFVAEGVGDLEGFEFGDAVSGLLPEGLEIGGVDLVLALNLFDHQLGVGDDAEAGVVVVEGVLEAAEEAGVFGVVIGAHAEEFAEFGDDHTLIILDEGPVAGWAGVAAGPAVAVGVDPGVSLGRFLGSGGRWVGEEAGGGGGTGSHGVSVPRWC
jgi:hypothetical protein